LADCHSGSSFSLFFNQIKIKKGAVSLFFNQIKIKKGGSNPYLYFYLIILDKKGRAFWPNASPAKQGLLFFIF
jgi:hypothetical protein